MRQYEYLKAGDPLSIQESEKMFSSPMLGHLSDDPVRNLKYLFVASVTLATRFAIEGGLESETAYNVSDLYIQKLDKLNTEAEIRALNKEMFTFFTKRVAAAKTRGIYSKPVVECIDYIYYHLHERVKLAELAKSVSLNPSYLSTLFKKEVGVSVSDYIMSRRIEAAENMLKYADYSYSQIGAYLAFNEQSYFIKVFKRYTGITPREYRNKYFRFALERD